MQVIVGRRFTVLLPSHGNTHITIARHKAKRVGNRREHTPEREYSWKLILIAVLIKGQPVVWLNRDNNKKVAHIVH